MHQRKPRQSMIRIDFDEDTVISGVQVSQDGRVTLLDREGKPMPVQRGSAGLTYRRRKGAKTTVQIPDAGMQVGDLLAALGTYDRIVGADTNSRDVNGEHVCVTGVCELTDVCLIQGKWYAEIAGHLAIEFRDPTEDAERLGWQHALEFGDELGWISGETRLLLVVDAHLSEHSRLNMRTAAFVGDLLLPDGVQIAYASSDTPRDSPLNRLIAQCDRFARIAMTEALRTPPSSEQEWPTNGRYKQCRRWVERGASGGVPEQPA
jgi:hypothetical protein